MYLCISSSYARANLPLIPQPTSMSLKLSLLAVAQLKYSGAQLQVWCVLHGAVQMDWTIG